MFKFIAIGTCLAIVPSILSGCTEGTAKTDLEGSIEASIHVFCTSSPNYSSENVYWDVIPDQPNSLALGAHESFAESEDFTVHLVDNLSEITSGDYPLVTNGIRKAWIIYDPYNDDDDSNDYASDSVGTINLTNVTFSNDVLTTATVTFTDVMVRLDSTEKCVSGTLTVTNPM